MVDPKLTDYIRNQLNKGVSENKLRGILASSNWSDSEINEAFDLVKVELSVPVKTEEKLQEKITKPRSKKKLWYVIGGIICFIILIGIFSEEETVKIEEPTKETQKEPELSKEGITLGSEQLKMLEDSLNEMFKIFDLPVNVYAVIDDCGEVNAFYDPENTRIIMCSELTEYFIQLSSQHTESEEEFSTLFTSTLTFTFFHEMGHALIDVLDLPITGKEEDAVDQLATWILIEVDKEKEEGIALDGAYWFFLEGQKTDKELVYWDEHSFDMQRFYNIVCWVYGSDPQKYASLIEEGILPEERAVRCEAEYQQLSKSWETILLPHIKK